MKVNVVVLSLVLMPLLTVNAQRHRATSTADYSPLTSASARQRTQKTDLKRLEDHSARLAAASPQHSRSSSQNIRPLKLDASSRGNGINFSGKGQKIGTSSGGRAKRSARHSRSRRH